MRNIARTVFVKADLRAFHTDPVGDAGRHEHVWTFKPFFPSEPFVDGREREDRLSALLASWQGTDLPPDLWAAEDLAARVLMALADDGCLGIEVDRRDGPGAEAWWS